MTKFLISLLSLFASTEILATEPQAAYKMVKNGEAVMIDVREKDEVKSGIIKEAKWFPLSKISNDKNWKNEFTKIVDGKKIFLYCRSGRRSEKVMTILKENGITSENIGGHEELKKMIQMMEHK